MYIQEKQFGKIRYVVYYTSTRVVIVRVRAKRSNEQNIPQQQ